MKKRLLLCTFICVIALVFCGCDDFMMTWEYKKFVEVEQRWAHGEVFTKESLLNELDYPKYYSDNHGEHTVDDNNHEKYKNKLMGKDVNQWSFFCYKHPDPAGPHVLEVGFDDNDKAVVMAVKVAPEHLEIEEPKINEMILFE